MRPKSSCDMGHQSGILHAARKCILLGGQHGENKPSEPKNGIKAPKSVWSCEISIDWKFYIEQEKTYFWGSKGENKPLEPENGICAPKSVWSCEIYIDREFYMEPKKYFLD
jgi:hypothetical protein